MCVPDRSRSGRRATRIVEFELCANVLITSWFCFSCEFCHSMASPRIVLELNAMGTFAGSPGYKLSGGLFWKNKEKRESIGWFIYSFIIIFILEPGHCFEHYMDRIESFNIFVVDYIFNICQYRLFFIRSDIEIILRM